MLTEREIKSIKKLLGDKNIYLTSEQIQNGFNLLTKQQGYGRNKAINELSSNLDFAVTLKGGPNETGTVTPGSAKDTAKTDKAVEEETAKLQSKVKPNQVNLAGVTASDPNIGKTGAQLQAEKVKPAAFTGDYDEWQKINAESDVQAPSSVVPTPSPQVSDVQASSSDVPASSSDEQVSVSKGNQTSVNKSPTSRYTSNKSPYKQPMSILDAYRSGLFGDKDAVKKFESTHDMANLSEAEQEEYARAQEEAKMARHSRDYYLMDALARFGDKMANSTGRIAAAYGGGSYEPVDTTSAWEQRNNELLKSGTEAETAGIEGSERNISAEQAGQTTSANDLELEQKQAMLIPTRIFLKAAGDPNASPEIKNLYAMLAANAAGNNQDVADYIAGWAAGNPNAAKLMNNLSEALSNVAGGAAKFTGTANSIAGQLLGLFNQ